MNWKSAIEELQSFNLSQPQIAAACKCGQSTISDLAKGKTTDPRWSTGDAIKALLAQKRAEKDVERRVGERRLGDRRADQAAV